MGVSDNSPDAPSADPRRVGQRVRKRTAPAGAEGLEKAPQAGSDPAPPPKDGQWTVTPTRCSATRTLPELSPWTVTTKEDVVSGRPGPGLRKTALQR